MFDRKEEIKIERNFLSLYFYPFVPYSSRQNTPSPPPQNVATTDFVQINGVFVSDWFSSL